MNIERNWLRGFYSDKNTEYNLTFKEKVSVGTCLAVTGLSFAENGCCENKPILITVSRETIHDEKPIYSCQCACGLWCTTGHTTDWEALKDYEDMTRRSKEDKRNEAV